MDKPRHPQVVRPWKTRQMQSMKWAPQPGVPVIRTRQMMPRNPKHG